MDVNKILDDGFFVTWKQVISIFFLTPPGVLIIYFALAEIFTAEAGPQWFQAVGTMFAIVAAIWIAKAEERRRRVDKRNSACHYMEGARLIALSTALLLRRISNELESFTSADKRLTAKLAGAQNQLLDSMLIDLQSVDVMKIEDIGCQSAFMDLKRRTYLAPKMIESFVDRLTSDHARNFSDWVSGAESSVSEMALHLAEFRNVE